MAIQNNTELNTQVNNDLPDNTTGLITPAKLRSIIANLVESLWNKKADPVNISITNVATLRTLTATIISEGIQNITLLGYSSPNDGGGGNCWIDRSDTTTEDDGGITFVTVSGLRIKRIVVGYLTLKQFGAKGDATTDDTVFIQNAINTASSLRKELVVTNGIYKITNTITIKAFGLIFRGTNTNYCEFRWAGISSTIPMFLVANCLSCRFSDFSIEFQTDLEVAIRLINNPALGGTINSNNLFENINIGNNSRGNNKILKYGIEITGASSKGSVDSNNDLHRFANLSIAGYNEAAIHMDTCSQSHDLLFLACNCTGVITNGKYVLKHTNGFFTWINGSGGFSTIADFHIGNTNSPISIIKWNSEHSAKLLIRPGTSNAPQVIKIDGIRFETELASDDAYIQWNGLAAMSVENCHVNFYEGNKQPKVVVFNFGTNTLSQKGGLIHCNNTYGTAIQGVLDRVVVLGGATSVLSFNNFNTNPNQERLNDVFTDLGDIAANTANFNKLSVSRSAISTNLSNAGTLEFDGANLYFSNGIERRLINTNIPALDVISSPIELANISDGDENGLFYLLGTQYGSQSWSNPASSNGLLNISTTTGIGRPLENLTDRTNTGFDNINLSDVPASIIFDIGVGKKLYCKKYSIRDNADVSFQLRTWRLRGSNDLVNWVDLDIQINNISFRSGGLTWLTLPALLVNQAFRYFNFINYLNSEGNKWIYLGEIELYGTLDFGKPNLLVNNPSFESDFNSWLLFGTDIAITTNSSRTGTKAAQLNAGSTSNYIFQNPVIIEVGKTYIFGCWTVNNNTVSNAYIYIKEAVPETRKTIIMQSTNYKMNSIRFTATGTQLECGVGIDSVANTNSVIIDDFFLYEV